MVQVSIENRWVRSWRGKGEETVGDEEGETSREESGVGEERSLVSGRGIGRRRLTRWRSGKRWDLFHPEEQYLHTKRGRTSDEEQHGARATTTSLPSLRPVSCL